MAHSMGGLVSRQYIKDYGDDSVYKLIMIGTPNHGVYGQVDDFCSSFLIFNLGANIECEEMAHDSTFIYNINKLVIWIMYYIVDLYFVLIVFI